MFPSTTLAPGFGNSSGGSIINPSSSHPPPNAGSSVPFGTFAGSNPFGTSNSSTPNTSNQPSYNLFGTSNSSNVKPPKKRPNPSAPSGNLPTSNQSNPLGFGNPNPHNSLFTGGNLSTPNQSNQSSYYPFGGGNPFSHNPSFPSGNSFNPFRPPNPRNQSVPPANSTESPSSVSSNWSSTIFFPKNASIPPSSSSAGTSTTFSTDPQQAPPPQPQQAVQQGTNTPVPPSNPPPQPLQPLQQGTNTPVPVMISNATPFPALPSILQPQQLAQALQPAQPLAQPQQPQQPVIAPPTQITYYHSPVLSLPKISKPIPAAPPLTVQQNTAFGQHMVNIAQIIRHYIQINHNINPANITVITPLNINDPMIQQRQSLFDRNLYRADAQTHLYNPNQLSYDYDNARNLIAQAMNHENDCYYVYISQAEKLYNFVLSSNAIKQKKDAARAAYIQLTQPQPPSPTLSDYHNALLHNLSASFDISEKYKKNRISLQKINNDIGKLNEERQYIKIIMEYLIGLYNQKVQLMNQFAGVNAVNLHFHQDYQAHYDNYSKMDETYFDYFSKVNRYIFSGNLDAALGDDIVNILYSDLSVQNRQEKKKDILEELKKARDIIEEIRKLVDEEIKLTKEIKDKKDEILQDETHMETQVSTIHRDATIAIPDKEEQVRAAGILFINKKKEADDFILKKHQKKEWTQNKIMEKINDYFQLEKNLWFSEKKSGWLQNITNYFVTKRSFYNTYESLTKDLLQYLDKQGNIPNAMQLFIIKKLLDRLYDLLCINNIIYEACEIKRDVITEFNDNIYPDRDALEEESKDIKKSIIDMLIQSILTPSSLGGANYVDLDAYMNTHLRQKKQAEASYIKLKSELKEEDSRKCKTQSLIKNSAMIYYIPHKTCKKYDKTTKEYFDYYVDASEKIIDSSSKIINAIGGVPDIANVKTYILQNLDEIYKLKLSSGFIMNLLIFFSDYQKERREKKTALKNLKETLYCYEKLDDMYKKYYSEVNDRISNLRNVEEDTILTEMFKLKTSEIKMKELIRDLEEGQKKLTILDKILREDQPDNYQEINIQRDRLEKKIAKLQADIATDQATIDQIKQAIDAAKRTLDDLFEKEKKINYGFFSCKVLNQQITSYLDTKEKIITEKGDLLEKIYDIERYINIAETQLQSTERMLEEYKSKKLALSDANMFLTQSPLRFIFKKSRLVEKDFLLANIQNALTMMEHTPEKLRTILSTENEELYRYQGAYQQRVEEYESIMSRILELSRILVFTQKDDLLRAGMVKIKPKIGTTQDFLRDGTYMEVIKRVGVILFQKIYASVADKGEYQKIVSLCTGSLEPIYNNRLTTDHLFGDGAVSYVRIEDMKVARNENMELFATGVTIRDNIEWMQYRSYVNSRSYFFLKNMTRFDGTEYYEPDGTPRRILSQYHINKIKALLGKKISEIITLDQDGKIKHVEDDPSLLLIKGKNYISSVLAGALESLKRLYYYYGDIPADSISNFISRSGFGAEYAARDQENLLKIRQFLEANKITDVDDAELTEEYNRLKLVFPLPRSSDLPVQNREEEKIRAYDSIIHYYENILLKDREYTMMVRLSEYCVAPIQDMICKRNTFRDFTTQKQDPYIFFDNKERMTGSTTRPMDFEDQFDLKLLYVLNLNNPYFTRCLDILSNIFACIDDTLENMELEQLDPYYDWSVAEKLFCIYSSPTRKVVRGFYNQKIVEPIKPNRWSDGMIADKINEKVDYILKNLIPVFIQCVEYLKVLEDEIIVDSYEQDEFQEDATTRAEPFAGIGIVGVSIATFIKNVASGYLIEDASNPLLFNNTNLNLEGYTIWDFDPNKNITSFPCVRYDIAYRYMKMAKYHMTHPRNMDSGSYFFHPFNLSIINGYYEQEDARKNAILQKYREDLPKPLANGWEYKIAPWFDMCRTKEKRVIQLIEEKIKDPSVKMKCRYHLTKFIYILKLYGESHTFMIDQKVLQAFYEMYGFLEDQKNIINDYLVFIRDTYPDYNQNISLLTGIEDPTFWNISFDVHDLVFYSIQMQIYYRWRDFLSLDTPYTFSPNPTTILPFCTFAKDELSVPFGFAFYYSEQKNIETDEKTYRLEMFAMEKQYYYLGICGREINNPIEWTHITNKFATYPDDLFLAKKNWVPSVLYTTLDKNTSKPYGVCKNFTFTNDVVNKKEYILSMEDENLVCFLIFLIKAGKKPIEDINDLYIEVYGIFGYGIFPKKIFFLGKTKIDKELLPDKNPKNPHPYESLKLGKEKFFKEIKKGGSLKVESFLYNTISILKRKAVIILYNQDDKKILYVSDNYPNRKEYDLSDIQKIVSKNLEQLEAWNEKKYSLQSLVNEREIFDEKQQEKSMFSYILSLKKEKFDQSKYSKEIQEYAKTKHTYSASMEQIENKIKYIQRKLLYRSIFATCLDELEIANKEKRLETFAIPQYLLAEKKGYLRDIMSGEFQQTITSQWKVFFKDGPSKIDAIVKSFEKTWEQEKNKYKSMPDIIPSKKSEELDSKYQKLFLGACEKIISLFPEHVPEKNKVYIHTVFNNPAFEKPSQDVIETTIISYGDQFPPKIKQDTALSSTVSIQGKYEYTAAKHKLMKKNFLYEFWFIPKDYDHLDNSQSMCYSIPIYFEDIAMYLERRYCEYFTDKTSFEIIKNIWGWLQLKTINLETSDGRQKLPENIIRIKNIAGSPTRHFFTIEENQVPQVTIGQQSYNQFSLKITYEGNKNKSFVTTPVILRNNPLQTKMNAIKTSLGLFPASSQKYVTTYLKGQTILQWQDASMMNGYAEWKAFMENTNPQSIQFETIANFPNIPNGYAYFIKNNGVTEDDADLVQLYLLPTATNLYRNGGYMKKLITRDVRTKIKNFFVRNQSTEFIIADDNFIKIVSSCDWFSFAMGRSEKIPTYISDDLIEVRLENYSKENCELVVHLSYSRADASGDFIRYISAPERREVGRPLLMSVVPKSVKKKENDIDSCKSIKNAIVFYLEARRYRQTLDKFKDISIDLISNEAQRENLKYLKAITEKKLKDLELRMEEMDTTNSKGIKMSKIIESVGRELLGKSSIKELEELLKHRGSGTMEDFLEKQKYAPQRMLEIELKKKRRMKQTEEEKEYSDSDSEEEEDIEKIKEKIQKSFKEKRWEIYGKFREYYLEKKEKEELSGYTMKEKDKITGKYNPNPSLYHILGYAKEGKPTFSSQNVQDAVQRLSEGLMLDNYKSGEVDLEEEKRVEQYQKEQLQLKYNKLTEEGILLTFFSNAYEGLPWLPEKKEKKRRTYFKELFRREMQVIEDITMENELLFLQKKWMETYNDLSLQDEKKRVQLFFELKDVSWDDAFSFILQKQKNRDGLLDPTSSYHRDRFKILENTRLDRLKNFISTRILQEKTDKTKEITLDDYKKERWYYRTLSEEKKYKMQKENQEKTSDEIKRDILSIIEKKRERENQYRVSLLPKLQLYSLNDLKRRIKNALDMRLWLLECIRSNHKKENAESTLTFLETEIDLLENLMNQKLISEELFSQKIKYLRRKKEEAKTKIYNLEVETFSYISLFVSSSLTKEQEEEKQANERIISGEYMLDEINSIREEYYREGRVSEDKWITMIAYDIVYPIEEQKGIDRWIQAERNKIEKEWGTFSNYRAHRRELAENGLELNERDLQYFNKIEANYLEKREDVSERSKRLRYLRTLRYPSNQTKSSITPEEERELSFLEKEDYLYSEEHQENEDHLQYLLEKNMLSYTNGSVELLIKIKKICDFLTKPETADRDCNAFAEKQERYLENMGFPLSFFQNKQNRETYKRIMKKYKKELGGSFFYALNSLRKLRNIKYTIGANNYLNPCDYLRWTRLQKKVESRAEKIKERLEEIKSNYRFYQRYSAEDKKELEKLELMIAAYNKEVEMQIKEEDAMLLYQFDNSFEKLKRFKKDVDDIILLQKAEEKEITISEDQLISLRKKRDDIGNGLDISFFEKENREAIYKRLEMQDNTISSTHKKMDRWVELASIKNWDPAFFEKQYGKEWKELSADIQKNMQHNIKKLKNLEWTKKLNVGFVSSDVSSEIEALKKLIARNQSLDEEKANLESNDMLALFGNSLEELEKTRKYMKRLLFLDGKDRTESEEEEYLKLLDVEDNLREKGIDRNYFFGSHTMIEAYQKIKEKLYETKGGKLQFILENLEKLHQKNKKERLTTEEQTTMFDDEKKAGDLYQKIYYTLFQLSFFPEDKNRTKIDVLHRLIDMYTEYSLSHGKVKISDNEEANAMWESYGKSFEKLWINVQYCKDLTFLRNMENASRMINQNTSEKIKKLQYYTEDINLMYDTFEGKSYERYLIIRNRIFENDLERKRYKLNLLRILRDRKYKKNETLSKDDSYMLEKLKASVSKGKQKVQKRCKILRWMASVDTPRDEKEWLAVEDMVKQYSEEDQKELEEEAEWMKECWVDLDDIKKYINHLTNPHGKNKIENGTLEMKKMKEKEAKFSEKDAPFIKPFNIKRNVEVFNYLKEKEKSDKYSMLTKDEKSKLFLFHFIQFFLEDWGVLSLTERMHTELHFWKKQNSLNAELIRSYWNKAKEEDILELKEMKLILSRSDSASDELKRKYARKSHYDSLRHKKEVVPLGASLSKEETAFLQEKIKHTSSTEIAQHFDQLLFLREFLDVIPSSLSQEIQKEWLSQVEKEIDFFIPWIKNYWMRDHQIYSMENQLKENLKENHYKIARYYHLAINTQLTKKDDEDMKKCLDYEMVETQMRHIKSKITEWMHRKYKKDGTVTPLSYDEQIQMKAYKRYLKNGITQYIRENIMAMDAQSFESNFIRYDRAKVEKGLSEISKNVKQYLFCFEFIKYPVLLAKSGNYGLMKTERENLIRRNIDFKPSKLRTYNFIKNIFYKKMDASFFACDDTLQKNTVYVNPFYYLNWLEDPLYKKQEYVEETNVILLPERQDDGDILKASPKYKEYESSAFNSDPTREKDIHTYWERWKELSRQISKDWVRLQDIPPDKKHIADELHRIQNNLDELLQKTTNIYSKKDRIAELRGKEMGTTTDTPITTDEQKELEQLQLMYLYEKQFFDILQSYIDGKITFVDEEKLVKILKEETQKIEQPVSLPEIDVTSAELPSASFENSSAGDVEEEEPFFNFSEDSNEVELQEDTTESRDDLSAQLGNSSEEVMSDSEEAVDDSVNIEIISDSEEAVDDSVNIEIISDSEEAVEESEEVINEFDEAINKYIENEETHYIKNILPSNITKNIEEKMENMKWFYYFRYRPTMSYPIILEKSNYIKNVQYNSSTDKLTFDGSEYMNDQYTKYICVSQDLPYHLYESFRKHYVPSLPDKDYSNALQEEYKIEHDEDPSTIIYFVLSGDTTPDAPKLYKKNGIEYSTSDRNEYKEIKKMASNPIEDFIWDCIISNWYTYGPLLQENIIKNTIAPNGLTIQCESSETKPTTHYNVTVIYRTPYFPSTKETKWSGQIKLFDISHKDFENISRNFEIAYTSAPRISPPKNSISPTPTKALTTKATSPIASAKTSSSRSSSRSSSKIPSKSSSRSSSRSSSKASSRSSTKAPSKAASKASSRSSSKASSRSSSKASSRSSTKAPSKAPSKSSSRSSSRSSSKAPSRSSSKPTAASSSTPKASPCRNGYVKKVNAKGIPYYLDKKGKRVSAEIGKKHCS